MANGEWRMMSKLQVQIETLKALNSCVPYALPEETLLTQVKCLVPGKLLQSEFNECLRELERKQFIVGVKSGLGDGVKWKITDNGAAMLAEISGG